MITGRQLLQKSGNSSKINSKRKNERNKETRRLVSGLTSNLYSGYCVYIMNRGGLERERMCACFRPFLVVKYGIVYGYPPRPNVVGVKIMKSFLLQVGYPLSQK